MPALNAWILHCCATYFFTVKEDIPGVGDGVTADMCSDKLPIM